MAGVMLGTIVVISTLNAYLAGNRSRNQIERQLRNVALTLTETSFPLTDAVLRQMSGLSGAEFALQHEEDIIATSQDNFSEIDLPDSQYVLTREQLTLGKTVRIGEQQYFHTPVQLHRKNTEQDLVLLHIFYPVQSYREAWWQAVYPPLVVGGVALVLVVLFGAGIASRVSRPIRQLQSQVDRIAEGDFQPFPLTSRNDEILDLSKAINRMAVMLARYEDEVRRNEQLRTLGQLGGGIAHQMRNSATGCRMALDLHRRECPLHEDDESLRVAVRQLTLMEKYLKQFLSLGSQQAKPFSPVDFAKLVENVLPLVRPAAEHVGIELEWNSPSAPLTIHADADALEQMLVNLLLNAIEAASRCEADGTQSAAERRVIVQLCKANESNLLLAVKDTGPGPAAEISDKLFEPLVSEKSDGVGLGLTVAREIAERHQGNIHWRRENDMTCFAVELPLLKPLENSHVETASR